jgi:hypothetical protein
VLGVLLFIASVGYFIDNTASFILPDYADHADTFQMIVMIAFPVELIMALWLLVKGINIKSAEEGANVDRGYAIALTN